MNSTQQEIFDTVMELVDTKVKLENKTRKRLSTKTKTYKKLADIEIMLSKIECHLNASRKYEKLQTSLIYHLVKSNCNYNTESVEQWWKEYCRIVD